MSSTCCTSRGSSLLQWLLTDKRTDVAYLIGTFVTFAWERAKIATVRSLGRRHAHNDSFPISSSNDTVPRLGSHNCVTSCAFLPQPFLYNVPLNRHIVLKQFNFPKWDQTMNLLTLHEVPNKILWSQESKLTGTDVLVYRTYVLCRPISHLYLPYILRISYIISRSFKH
jgi:hypothetical protein